MDDTEMESSERAASNTPVPRAAGAPIPCDACRARKIRCNRESPCAHCLQAKIECAHSENRPKETRTRILLTPQYERKIDHIDRRLDGVVQLLEELKQQLRTPINQQPTPVLQVPSSSSSLSISLSASLAAKPSSSSVPSPASHASHAEISGPVVEGDSSLTAHSVFANDLLQKLVDGDSSMKMHDTLDALRSIVDTMKQHPAALEMAYPNAKVLPTPPSPIASLRSRDLPPIERTVQLLKISKSQVPPLAWIFALFPSQKFPERCMNVYFSDDYTEADFIIVNTGLHLLFWTYSSFTQDEAEEYKRHSRLCAINLETALSNLPLHLPATSDHILALICGTFYLIEASKPSIAWILVTKASELCQTLGYHRTGTSKNDYPDDARHKKLLFWAVYVLDKSLCLRLGRSSSIQDYDITVAYPSGAELHRIAIAAFMKLWIQGARIQGLIYEKLYCPEAIAQPEIVRRPRMQELVQLLEDLDLATTHVTTEYSTWCKAAIGSELEVFFNKADDVLRLSLLTLVYRSVPNPPGSPTTFSPECIRAARATLDIHQDCIAIINTSTLGLFSTYMHWTILFSPFIPFIVLFCHTIETHGSDRADLTRLQAFVASISQSETPMSSESETDAVIRLRKLFQVLCNVAVHYVDAHGGGGGGGGGLGEQGLGLGLGVGRGEVDAYLATLGFPAVGGQGQGQESEGVEGREGNGGGVQEGMATTGVNPMLWMGNGTQLEDWFYNNEQMMEFLEDGSFGFP